jgi:hypothetical protein
MSVRSLEDISSALGQAYPFTRPEVDYDNDAELHCAYCGGPEPEGRSCEGCGAPYTVAAEPTPAERRRIAEERAARMSREIALPDPFDVGFPTPRHYWGGPEPVDRDRSAGPRLIYPEPAPLGRCAIHAWDDAALLHRQRLPVARRAWWKRILDPLNEWLR